MANRSGYLTVYSADRSEIYGEFGDAEWSVENTAGGTNSTFSGIAGDGALQTFIDLNAEGISNVAFTFESSGEKYSGDAQLLAPPTDSLPGAAVIRIETGKTPSTN